MSPDEKTRSEDPECLLLNMPIELLRMIVDKIDDHASVVNLSSACSALYVIVSERILQTVLLKADSLYYRYAFLRTMFTENYGGVCNAKRVDIIPYRKNLCSGGDASRSKPLFSPPVMFEDDDFTKILHINPAKIQALNLCAGASMVPQNVIVEYLRRWPHLKQLSLDLSLSLLLRSDFKRAVTALDSLECLAFTVWWTGSTFNLEPEKMDLNPIWDAVNANANTLKCLRVNFCAPNALYSGDHRLSKRERNRLPDVLLIFLGYFDKWPSSSCLHNPAPKLRALFPCRPEQWPQRLELEVLQLFYGISCIPAISRNITFFRPETLEVLSLIDCIFADQMLNDMRWQFVNLTCLQVVSCVSVAMLGLVLPALNPLKAFYFVSRETEDQWFDYRYLTRHKDSLRVLWLEHTEEMRRNKGKIAVTAIPPGGSCVDWELLSVRFEEWSQLEELALTVCFGSIILTVGMPELQQDIVPPPSLKILRLIRYPRSLSNMDNWDTVGKYAKRQVKKQGGGTPNLRAVIADPCIPSTSAWALAGGAMIDPKPENPSMLIISGITPPSDDGTMNKPTVEKVDEREVRRRFPDVSVAPYYDEGNWINFFLKREWRANLRV
ncbi:hypothetical protein Dda_7488 [Drechslerella dactyloides]|uniref:F-box domain-containing protein n=1 Tax=Drechslerella dactyloides TaxID=74499 RepID=A0AAD6IU39_DREDA|nr:hypothetical protein Dda_7488 [Drechslerella dactyloides]